MKIILLAVCFILSVATVYAENWVCQDGYSLKRLNGDGYRLGICEKNNQNISTNCIEANDVEWQSSQLPNKKIDKSVVSGNRVVDMTIQEIEAKEKPAKDAAKALKDTTDALRLKLKGLGFTDEEVDLLFNNFN